MNAARSLGVPRSKAKVRPLLGGKWRVERCIGKGGTASVYVASHHNNGRRAALKVLASSLAGSAAARARFYREARTANLVAHRGVVSILDDGTTSDGRPFLVMELLEGKTLEARRKELPNGKLPLDEAIAIMLEVLEVLAQAHARGVVHRDLKPANVFLTRADGVKILDFGAAAQTDLPADGSVTRFEVVAGTMLFAAPEQARGGAIRPTNDVWSIGVLLYLLLSGRYPFEFLEEISYLAACARGAPRLDDVPRDVADVIATALAVDPAKRYPNAKALHAALAQAHVPSLARSGGRPKAFEDEPTRDDGPRLVRDLVPQKPVETSPVFAREPEQVTTDTRTAPGWAVPIDVDSASVPTAAPHVPCAPPARAPSVALATAPMQLGRNGSYELLLLVLAALFSLAVVAMLAPVLRP